MDIELYETEFPGMYVTEDGYLVDDEGNLYDEDGDLIEENALILNESLGAHGIAKKFISKTPKPGWVKNHIPINPLRNTEAIRYVHPKLNNSKKFIAPDIRVGKNIKTGKLKRYYDADLSGGELLGRKREANWAIHNHAHGVTPKNMKDISLDPKSPFHDLDIKATRLKQYRARKAEGKINKHTTFR